MKTPTKTTPGPGPTSRLIELGDGTGRVDLFLVGGQKLAVILPPGPHRLSDEWTVLDCEGRAVERNDFDAALAQAHTWATAWIDRNGGPR